MSDQAFAFIQITDHHVCGSDSAYIHGFATNYSMRAVLAHIAQRAAEEADFIVSTGDLVERAGVEEYGFYRSMLDPKHSSPPPGPQRITACGLQNYPIYFLPGNHDDRDLFFRMLFPGSAPAPLLNAVFTHQGIQFVILDWGPGVKGVMHAESLAFLREALRSRSPSILLMHHPVERVGSRWLDEFLADGVDAFWEAVAGKPVLGIFCGHVHATFESERQGIPFYTLRSTGFQFALQEEPLMVMTPPQYRIARVAEGKLTTEVVEVDLGR